MARRDEADVREAILNAARAEFMTEGFAAASVGHIARSAGVSTKTIYRFYETKTDILADVISSFMALMLPGLDTYVVARAEDLAPELVRLLTELAGYGLSAPGLAANRLATTEMMRVPEMVTAYYREGHEKIIAAVGRWLARQCEAGWLRLDDPRRAAAMLLSMVFADLTRYAMLSGEPPTDAEIAAWIGAGVEIFLKGAVPR
ncbi:TetR/AcrR family transcriptional regulator [Zavarzinia compransoris]|uniref:TetR/AcrR family transcriptional regulator n=1 Tax=Zavarzinia marina TaxID=2911065 RepID=UPI001F45A421|nr:TetR/AcrR family transcriptional regulator [Zavarzinia marina]MCF4165252.1 TetR/AcrR family transcriptional regulator [Zavarzinia marina]